MGVSSEFESRGSEDRSLVRMNFRTKPRIKATIQSAAALAGLEDSAFTMQAAYQAARPSSGINAGSCRVERPSLRH